jgi:hypothetical protein
MVGNLEVKTMAIISNLNVNVGEMETELIGSTETNTHEDRVFHVGNGEKKIEVTAWGSNPGEDWIVIETKTINAEEYGTIVLGSNHHFYCKLTGKTLNPGYTSIVDAFFTYTPPT